MSRIFSGRVQPSHESGNIPSSGSKWQRGEVQEIVWKTFQREINGSVADVLLELYDDQRKQPHMLSATLQVVAMTLKDYSTVKVLPWLTKIIPSRRESFHASLFSVQNMFTASIHREN
eukprot:5718359-Amphidinium_carterae.1